MKNHFGQNTLKREISLFSAFILVVANMIGTGIYTTSGFIIGNLGNGKAMLLCWLFGGIFALSGALCYGELGAMFPKPGGEYIFLRESFGKCMAFLSGWISLIVGFSAPIAAASIAFAFYLFKILPQSCHQEYTFPLFGFTDIHLSLIPLTAITVIIFISFFHYHSLRLGSRIQNGLTIFKILLILTFIATGFSLGKGSIHHFGHGLDTGIIFSDKFAVSMIFVTFAYSGWNAAAYLGGEIKNPGRNIPLSLISGTLFVIILYLLLNAMFIYALGVENMKGILEVGETAARSLFDERASKYFSGAISIGILSAVSAMTMTGPRVYFSMAQDGVFFKVFSKVNPKHKTPALSIFLQAAIAILMILTCSFDKLLLYIGFTLSLFATMTVTGLMVLRIKMPSMKREFKTLGYPVVPLIFITGNLWIIFYAIKSRILVSLIGLGTIGIGLLLYLYFTQRISWKKSKEILYRKRSILTVREK